jgi:hypothetical protein
VQKEGNGESKPSFILFILPLTNHP